LKRTLKVRKKERETERKKNKQTKNKQTNLGVANWKISFEEFTF
jgi:hypothetical protein